ncbi:hypothetical protein HC256_009655 [Beauveria bassiana]|uniref:GPI anchored CFEM domain protein n=1 Tax=Beauveria bassiana (strain ARSEF 2860) TaxID=655819 RepID=J4KM55_BEAB2|nr:GPI anchored CFEM domain protein [Beauveria bassiana ARSEF 2860]EJP63364.1 GPI anchored CFEM domain protein [Beauveria bassiana ARSEF 2860]KAH8709745.1 hypothetical protein HC256_009655 [Beauveria bassiana]
MKAIILLACARLVTAQSPPDISDVPQCAITCLLPALSSTGCSLTDLTCACLPKNRDKIKSQARPCIEKSCSKDDLSKAFDASDSLCGTSASQSLTTHPDTSTSAVTDTPTSKSNPAATTSEIASSGSESITTTSEHGASASRSASTTSTSRDPSGSLSATSTSSTGGSGNSEPHLSTTLPTTTGQSNSSDGGGLSKGATAGIGVGAGLGGIAVITGLASFFYVRGKKAGKRSRDVEETTDHQNSTFNSIPPPKQFSEVQGNPVAELP